MGDLISRSALIEELHHIIEDDADLRKDYEYIGIDDYIRSMPTAYDVEKVVAEIQKIEFVTAYEPTDYEKAFLEKLKKLVISIVKRGGVE